MDNPSPGMPALTVVITTWNRAGMIADAVESAVSQDCQESLEVIVVDDGSTDGTTATLADLERRSLPQNRLLRIIREDRRGRTGATQRGIDAASAPYLALLSSDDLWEPQRARELLIEERRLGGNALIYTGWKTRPAVYGDTYPVICVASAPRTCAPYRGWKQEPWILRGYVTSVLRHNPFPYPVCAAVFPRTMLQGRFRLPVGASSPDNWSAIAGYLQCTVGTLQVTSLIRRVHCGQQHALADANLWPGLPVEQETTAEAIVQLLTAVTPNEKSMITVMRAKSRLMALRRACRERHRMESLVKSLGLAAIALRFPALWQSILSNILLATSPRLYDAVRYGRPRWRLACASRR
jgi:hypothetical protein